MNENLVSAVFDNLSEAERAVSELRAAGVSDSGISIIAQNDGKNTATDGSGAEEATDVIGKTAFMPVLHCYLAGTEVAKWSG